ncbi:MAG TPA: IPT/TIG domain-containing protein, partial [Solirubrobacteraceae bacterium]|nr:IPT/TIG domain-containing protein [Solirubrobacteraceae bacterium]
MPLYKAQVSWRYYIFEGIEPDCEADEAVTCTPVAQGLKTEGAWNPLRDFTDVKEDGHAASPTVTGLSPNAGSTAGGTTVTVNGTGFAPGSSATTFTFGTTHASSVTCTST